MFIKRDFAMNASAVLAWTEQSIREIMQHSETCTLDYYCCGKPGKIWI